MTLPILYVEDDEAVRLAGTQTLELAGLEVIAAADAESALAVLVRGPLGAVVTDLRLPGLSGLGLQERVLAQDADTPVIVVTGHGDVDTAVTAMRAGAYDFIEKPYPAERLLDMLARALDRRRLVLENRELRARLAGQSGPVLIGDSAAMRELRATVADIADTGADVLIEGETGTGKELVARALHEWSHRRRAHFVALNCAALPETVFESEIFGHEAGAFTGAAKRRTGKVEHADGGTLFLDEIEGMPLALQAKFLRVLQERVVERLGGNVLTPVDCRVVAATKENLLAMAGERRFRADLYYRLNVVTLHLPPLRERREDIPALFSAFAAEAAERFKRGTRVPDAALSGYLAGLDWPGNVRELKHAAERWVLGMAPREWPGQGGGEPVAAGQTLAARVDAFERQQLVAALQLHGGQATQTAAALGLPRKTLYDKLARHGIEPADYRA